MPDPGSASDRALQRRGLDNLSRMGHCAPSIMQTLLELSDPGEAWLVKLAAGLPGGIGNTGGECGGVTASLMWLGLRHAKDPPHRGLPVIVYKAHDFVKGFEACQGATTCREIRGEDRLPLQCIGVVRQTPALCMQTLRDDCSGAISDEQRRAFARLYAHWLEQDFHCAHAVFRGLASAIPNSQELRDATAGFLGGTAFTGNTCSAFTAGVMALGVALGRIEDSRLRVLRMIARMAFGGDAFADDLNAFNRIMNLGNRLSRWFAAELGSTQCRAITDCDFSAEDGVERYIRGGGTARCRVIAKRVALEVATIAAAHEVVPAGTRWKTP